MWLGPDAWGLAVMEGRGLVMFGPAGYGMDRTGMAVQECTGRHWLGGVCSGPERQSGNGRDWLVTALLGWSWLRLAVMESHVMATRGLYGQLWIVQAR